MQIGFFVNFFFSVCVPRSIENIQVVVFAIYLSCFSETILDAVILCCAGICFMQQLLFVFLEALTWVNTAPRTCFARNGRLLLTCQHHLFPKWPAVWFFTKCLLSMSCYCIQKKIGCQENCVVKWWLKKFLKKKYEEFERLFFFYSKEITRSNHVENNIRIAYWRSFTKIK